MADETIKTKEMTDEEYYKQKILSVTSVRQFAQNPARALDAWNDVMPWFVGDDKALNYGKYVHASLQDFFVDGTENAEALLKSTPSMFKKTGDHGLLATYAQAGHVFEVLKNNDVIKWIYDKLHSDDERYTGFVELPMLGVIDGVDFRGKPDVFIVDEKTKHTYMFDFKTSAKYSPDGYDWGETLEHKRDYGNVAWHADKLFPWQAGTYRELMNQNGYADYKIVYRYVVATKENEPRIDIWEITDEAMDLGFSEFKRNLKLANLYISDKADAPVVEDGSAWANLRTQAKGANLIVDVPEDMH